MDRILVALLVAGVCICAPAHADSITGPTISGENSITGPTITSTNSGTVTATGTFNGRTTIIRGRGNNIGVSAVGAGVTAQILREGGDPDASTSDNITINSITATNTVSGTVTATGTFNHTRIFGGNGNSVSVSAAGTQVTLSIIHR